MLPLYGHLLIMELHCRFHITSMRKKFAAIFLSLLSVLLLIAKSGAQDAGKITGLKNKLANEKTDSARADDLALLCYNYSTLNPDSGLIFGKQALELSQKIGYPKGVADAYNSMGWAFYRKGDRVKAKEYLSISMEKFKAIGNKEWTLVPLSNLATVYTNEDDYAGGLRCYLEAFKDAQEVGDTKSEALILFSMGRIYNLQKDFLKARSYFQQAYDLHKLLGNELNVAEALMSIANTYQYEGKNDTALILYEQALVIFQKHNDLYRTGMAYENMADLNMNTHQPDDALKNYLLAKKYYTQLSSKEDLVYALMGIGEAYSAMKEYPEALNALKEALQDARDISSKDLEQQISLNLSNVYSQTEDFKNAYEFSSRSSNLKDSLFTEQKQSELLKLQTQFETDRKEKENLLLKAENEAAIARLDRDHAWLIAAGISLLVLSLLTYIIFRNRQAKIKNIEVLEELNEKLKKQTEEISRMNSILELRALRAQMNPHFIFNCMSSIQECILTGEIDDANKYLSKLSRLLRMVLEFSEQENISLDKELEMLNLYLQLESARLKENFHYEIKVNEEIFPEEVQVPTFILQPFAENAIWHGLLPKESNRKLKIEINQHDHSLNCVVEDNGVGRGKAEALQQVKKRPQSRGIRIVRDRLNILKKRSPGTDAGFEIIDLFTSDHVSSGTRVEIRLPLDTPV